MFLQSGPGFCRSHLVQAWAIHPLRLKTVWKLHSPEGKWPPKDTALRSYCPEKMDFIHMVEKFFLWFALAIWFHDENSPTSSESFPDSEGVFILTLPSYRKKYWLSTYEAGVSLPSMNIYINWKYDIQLSINCFVFYAGMESGITAGNVQILFCFCSGMLLKYLFISLILLNCLYGIYA